MNKMVILEFFKLEKDKNSIVSSLLFKDQTKKLAGGKGLAVAMAFGF